MIHYDRQGNAIPTEEWAALYEQESYRVVKDTGLPDGGHVFTIWNGTPPVHAPDKPRDLFTTVHCSADHYQLTGEYDDTEAEALERHGRMVAQLGGGH